MQKVNPIKICDFEKTSSYDVLKVKEVFPEGFEPSTFSMSPRRSGPG